MAEVSVKIPTPLQKLTKGKAEVKAKGSDVKELIEDLEKQFSGIKERICDKDGKLRRFVNIYVNEEDIRFLKQDKTLLKNGDEVSIIPAIAGGGSTHFVRSPLVSRTILSEGAKRASRRMNL